VVELVTFVKAGSSANAGRSLLLWDQGSRRLAGWIATFRQFLRGI